MATCWSTVQVKNQNANTSMSELMFLSIEDVEPSTESAAMMPYRLDYSLMTIFFAILFFLWMQ